MSKQDKEVEIVALEVELVNALLKKWQKTPREFVDLDEKLNILWYIGKHYDTLHMMGTKSIIKDIEQYVKNKGGVTC